LVSVMLVLFAADTTVRGDTDSDGQHHALNLRVEASSSLLKLSDTLAVNVSITIEGKQTEFETAEVTPPSIPGFILVSTGTSSERGVVDGILQYTRVHTFRYIPLREGEQTIPAYSLRYTDRRTGQSHTLESAAIPVMVRGGRRGADSGWIRGPGPYIGAVTILILISGTLFVILRGRRKRLEAEREQQKEKVTDSTDELTRRIEIKLAHGKISEAQEVLLEAVKTYISDRYALAVDVSEAENTHKALLDVGAPKAVIDLSLRVIAWNVDLKFGGIPRTEAEITESVHALRQLMELQ
jgi:hypothetical protein